MLVHLGGGIRATGEDLPFFRNVVDSIREHGDVIAHNWIEVSHHNAEVKLQEDDEVDWREIFKDHEAALKQADVFIAEVSTYRLFHGYELAKAMQQGKPALLVSRKPFAQFAISGMEDDSVWMKEYETSEELKKIVFDFLEENTVSLTDRDITIPVDLRLHRYIVEACKKSGKTQAEVVRDLVQLQLKEQEYRP
jgi:hypothetical protein